MNDEVLGSLSGEPRDDRLKLPRGACIALRQSGGLRFSTREVIVYNDGRVAFRQQGKLGASEGVRHITPAEMADLKALIRQSGLLGLPRFASIGRQSPDAYAYELAARLERVSRSLEFFDGSIPPEVRPVLAQLKALMSEDPAQA